MEAVLNVVACESLQRGDCRGQVKSWPFLVDYRKSVHRQQSHAISVLSTCKILRVR